jgi:hypothetical protein
MDPSVTLEIMKEMEGMHARLSTLEFSIRETIMGKTDIPLSILSYIRKNKIDADAILPAPETIEFTHGEIKYSINIHNKDGIELVDHNHSVTKSYAKYSDLEDALALMKKEHHVSTKIATSAPARFEDIKQYSEAITQTKCKMAR